MSKLVRYVIIPFTTLSLSFALVAGAQTAKAPTKDRAKDKTSFKELIEQYYAAWNTGDPANAAPLYAKDANLIFYDITPLKYNGWREYDAGVRNVLGTFASAKFVPQPDMNVTRHGSIAWTTVTWHLSGKKKTGETVEMDGRHTAIWENRAGKWLIVHEHFSAPLQ